ncbi:MAG: class I SAM-dependent methyltransferase [Patescibacteria group bacterium]
MNNQSSKTVASRWEDALKSEGYKHSIKNKAERRRIKKFSRVWRRIFKYIPENIRLAEDKSVFEFGCGGGKHLAQFLFNGWRVAGIDCSTEVLKRAENYLREVKQICGCQKDFNLICGDFLDYKSDNKYDIVFNVGVIEHFLDDIEREKALKKMFDIAKNGGYVISIVPSGNHPLRQRMKEKCLGGYGIPEIDYTPEIMENEMRRCDVKNILILPHNIMGYRIINDEKGVLRLIDLFLYYIFQIIPLNLFPKSFLYRHAMTLIGIAKK